MTARLVIPGHALAGTCRVRGAAYRWTCECGVTGLPTAPNSIAAAAGHGAHKAALPTLAQLTGRIDAAAGYLTVNREVLGPADVGALLDLLAGTS